MKLDIDYGAGAAQRRLRRDPRARASRPVRDARRPSGRVDLRRQRQPQRLVVRARGGHSDSARSRAGLAARAARSCSPAGTARSTACSARPSGPSSTSAPCTPRRSPISTCDIAAGQRSSAAGAAPSLDKLLLDVTKTVPEPGGETSVFDAWRGDNPAPTIDRLGSGSDYTGALRPRRRALAAGGLHEPERRIPLGLRRHLPARALPRSWLRARGRRGEGPRRHRAAAGQRRRLSAALLRLRDRGRTATSTSCSRSSSSPAPRRSTWRRCERPRRIGARRRAGWRRMRPSCWHGASDAATAATGHWARSTPR